MKRKKSQNQTWKRKKNHETLDSNSANHSRASQQEIKAISAYRDPGYGKEGSSAFQLFSFQPSDGLVLLKL